MIKLTNRFSKKLLRGFESFEAYVQRARRKCDELKRENSQIIEEDYSYSVDFAKDELGLDDELIMSLVEDFVAQIVVSLPQFYEIIEELRQERERGREPDFSTLYDLAHKNLGVARNLRIKDAQKILHLLMKSNDVEQAKRYVAYLEACVTLLKPEVAYKAHTA